jgi:hypothetical protein
MMSNLASETVAEWKRKNIDQDRWVRYPPYPYTLLRNTNFPQLRLIYDEKRVASLTGSSHPNTKSTRYKIVDIVKRVLEAHFDKENFLVYVSKRAEFSVRVVVGVNDLEQLTILRLLEEQFCASETEYKWE